MELLIKANTTTGTYEVYQREDYNFLEVSISSEDFSVTANLYPDGYEVDDFAYYLLCNGTEIEFIDKDLLNLIYSDMKDGNQIRTFYKFMEKFDLFGMFC